MGPCSTSLRPVGRTPRASTEERKPGTHDQQEDAEGSLHDLRRKGRAQPRSEVGADEEAYGDQSRGPYIDVAGSVVLERPEQADRQKKRCQGGAGRRRDREARDQDERRNDHEPAPDPEEAGKHPAGVPMIAVELGRWLAGEPDGL